MSILSEITRITGNIADAYAAVSGKGGTLPTARNSDNLPDAIESIPSGLPDPTEFNDGTAMVVVDGEWTQQEGYGYRYQGRLTLADEEITCSDDIFDIGFPANLFSVVFELVAGNTYIVGFNGTEYEEVAYENPQLLGATVIGDMSNGYIIGYLNGNSVLAVYQDGTYSVSVASVGEQTQQIDESLTGISTKMDMINPTGQGSFSMGRKAETEIGVNSHAEGFDTEASGQNSHAEGLNTTASGIASHAEGYDTTASGECSHAEGFNTIASGGYSHAEGYGTKASGEISHAEGYDTTASGDFSHAEGIGTTASGQNSHAEGDGTEASEYSSHAEGADTMASGGYSHAEGYGTKASGNGSHAEGVGTTASGDASHVQGRYNVEDTDNDYADIIGNGVDSIQRKNIEVTTWTGDKRLKGDVYVHCNDDSTGGVKLATEESVDTALGDKADKNTVLSHTSDTTIHVTTAEKNTWNAKQNAIPANTYDAYGAADAVQTNLNAVTAKIPSAASSTNQLVSASEMGDAIEAVEAKQLYKTASQGSFATKAELLAATAFYGADGTTATPTRNDVAYVLADEDHSNKSAKYVIANDPSSTVAPVWGFVITFSDSTFTQTQMDAINSGATSAKISGYDIHVANPALHIPSSTTADNGKFLRVVNGAAAWATVPTMEGGSY